MKNFTICLCAIALLIAPVAVEAKVTVNPVFSDNMVLQRGMSVPVWGAADAGEEVTVKFAGQTKTAKAGADGKWSLKLDEMKASAKAQTMTIGAVTFKDVLIGDVWVGSGQSNMAGGIKERFGGTLTEEEKTPVPHILQVRFHTKRFRGEGWFPAVHPLHIIPGRPQSFGLGLPFAKEYLKRNPGVTIGLLPCAYGGKRMDLLRKGSGLYSGVVAKCRFAQEKGTIKGILWHQGESDAFNEDRCAGYEERLHEMIAGLRKEIGEPDLPFISGEISIKNYPKDNPVQVANSTLPEKVKNTGWIRTDDLTFCDGNKSVHFDRKSLIKMAHRYCAELMRIISEGSRGEI